MKTNKETMWNRLIKSVLPKAIQQAPPADLDRNTNTLARLEENDPTLACVRDHLFAQFSNELVVALDRSVPAAVRISALDSASGLQRFIEDLELRRQGWNEDRIEQLRQAERRQAAGGQKEKQA